MLAKITYRLDGWHCWPEAPEARDYLRSLHRHMFHYVVQIEVRHHDREIEYHDLLDFCKAHTLCGDMGRMSCEDMGAHLMDALERQYPGRYIEVEVMEDGECGAVLKNRTD